MHVVVDDRDEQPLRKFPELPIIISTKVDGSLMEAWMCLNLHIEYEDIIMRMPHLDAVKWAKKDAPGGFENTLSGRRRDFRKAGRCFSWKLNSSLSSAYDRQLRDDMAADPEAAQSSNPEARPSKKQKTSPLPQQQLPSTISPVPLNHSNQGLGTGPYKPWFPQIEGAPGHDETRITPAGLGPDVPYVPKHINHPSGPPLFASLAANGACYTPDSRLPEMSVDHYDARYTLARSAEDWRQLFFALYPLMDCVIKTFQLDRFEIDLTTYAQAWNQIEHHYVHATYRASHERALDLGTQRLVPTPEWNGTIGDFDAPRLPMDMWHDVAARDAIKVQNAPYAMWDDFVRKGQAMGVVAQATVVLWPMKLFFDSEFIETTGDFMLRLSDFE